MQLYHDIAQCYPEVHESRHDLRTLRNRVDSEGISFITKTLPKLGKRIDYSLSSDTSLQVSGFKLKPDSAIPLFLGWLLERVFMSNGYVRSDPDITALRHLRQFLYFTYKLSLPYDYETEQTVIDSFISTEVELSSFEFPPSDDPVISKARLFLSRVFDGFNVREIIPRHGPGAVSTGEEGGEKSNFSRILTRLERVYPFTDYFVLGPNQVSDQLDWIQALSVSETGTSKVVLVPKDSRGPRLISSEPLENQWIQQGIRRKMYRWIERHPMTRGHVNFRDQDVNRDLALKGSRDGSLVTLDMKDASDRVSLHLVKELFAGTELLEGLEASRSECTRLPDGRVVRMVKFAPMGSAVCFPVEALCFFALAVAVLYIRNRAELPPPPLWGTDPDPYDEQAWVKAHASVFVYGDDIICRREDYAPIMEYFPKVGLLFNTGKCCTGGLFRESCGCDAYGGVDVTPIRMRTLWSHRGKRNATELMSYVELSNSMWASGYWGTAEFIRDMVERRYSPLPYIRERYKYTDRTNGSLRLNQSALIGFCRPHVIEQVANHRLHHRRFSPELHRLEYRTWIVRPEKKTYPVDGWKECLRSMNEGSKSSRSINPDGKQSEVGVYALPRRVCLSRGWAAV